VIIDSAIMATDLRWSRTGSDPAWGLLEEYRRSEFADADG